MARLIGPLPYSLPAWALTVTVEPGIVAATRFMLFKLMLTRDPDLFSEPSYQPDHFLLARIVFLFRGFIAICQRTLVTSVPAR